LPTGRHSIATAQASPGFRMGLHSSPIAGDPNPALAWLR
jgi:hypothetical protein